jgi:AraC-like DNA-binding protein
MEGAIMRRDGSSTDAVQQHQFQERIRRLFTCALSKLFADCTGLRFHMSWAPPPPLAWESMLPAGCEMCPGRPGSKKETAAGCRGRPEKHFALTLQSGCRGHGFICPPEVANFWVPIQVQTGCVGIVCFQARMKPRGKGPGSAGLPVLTKSEFNRAARLLRLITHDVVHAALTETLTEELQHARHSLNVREKTETRLRQELHQVLPVVRANAAKFAPDTRHQQIVRGILDYIHQNYGRPMQLKECAEKMHRNAACLSALFSQAVGLPFKQYLTELRLQRAQELLSDPSQTVAEVAYAVGYTEPNRFRLAFKQWAGLPPTLWRGSPQAQKLRASQPAPHRLNSPSSLQTFDGKTKFVTVVKECQSGLQTNLLGLHELQTDKGFVKNV